MRKKIKRILVFGAMTSLLIPFAISFISQNPNYNVNKYSTNLATSNNLDSAPTSASNNQLMLFYVSSGSSHAAGYFGISSNNTFNFTLLSNSDQLLDANSPKEVSYNISFIDTNSNFNKIFTGGNTISDVVLWFNSIKSQLTTSYFIKISTTNPLLTLSFGGLGENGIPYSDKTYGEPSLSENSLVVGIDSSIGGLYQASELSLANVRQDKNILYFITSTFNGSTINISIPLANGKTISGSAVFSGNGQASYIMPTNIPINNPINYNVTILDSGNTPTATIYNEYAQSSQSQTYTFNLIKFGSLNPNSIAARGGNSIPLTNLADIPLQFTGNASVSFKLIGNIKGTYQFFQVDPNNDWSPNNPQNYNVSTSYSQSAQNMVVEVSKDKLNSQGLSPWTVSPNGSSIRYHFAINTSGITSDTNSQQPFNFKLEMTINPGTYFRQVPVFDNLTYQGQEYLISKWATNNGETFDKEIFNDINKYYGGEFITRGVRFFENDNEYMLNQNATTSSSNLNTFNANAVAQLYADTWNSFNTITGRVLNPTGDQIGFHQGWTHFGQCTNATGGWFSSSHGTFAAGNLFQNFLKSGWVIYHEIGHLFNQESISNYFGSEVYSNVSTYLASIMYGPIPGNLKGSGWYSGNISDSSISKALLPIYLNYFKNGTSTQNWLKNYNSGLRWFVSLLYYFPNYVTKFALFNDKYVSSYKFQPGEEESINNIKYPYSGIGWFVYFIASQYHVNIIPAMILMGVSIKNQSLINYVIDNSTSTLNVLPHTLPYWSNNNTQEIIKSSVLSNFVQFGNDVLSPTFTNPTIDSNNNTFTLIGINNPNNQINVDYNNKIYTTKCDSQSKFKITIPIVSNVDIATIWASVNNNNSLKQSFSINSEITNNAYTFTINSNANGSTDGLSFYSTPSNKLVAIAGAYNYYSEKTEPWTQIFFSMYNAEGQEIIKPIFVSWQGQGSTSESNITNNTPYTTILLQELNEQLKDMQLQIGDTIVITTPKNNGNNAGVVYKQEDSEVSKNLQSFSNTSNETIWKIVDTESGLYPLDTNFIDNMQTSNTFTTLPGASLYINGKLYSTANNIGINEISNNKLIFMGGVSYNYELKLGNLIVFQENTNTIVNSSSVNIINVWDHNSYTINFHDNNIYFLVGYALATDPQNNSDIYFTINLIDPTTKIIKFTWSGKDNGTIQPPSQLPYQVGDIFQIKLYGKQKINVNNVYSLDKTTNQIIKTPVVNIENSTTTPVVYNFYLSSTGLSLIPINAVQVSIYDIGATFAELTLGDRQYFIPLINSSYDGIISYFDEPSNNMLGSLFINNKTYKQNIRINNNLQTLNFQLSSKVVSTQQQLVNENINNINNANIRAKINTLANEVNISTISQYLDNLPKPLTGMTYSYQDVKVNSITGQATFIIVVNGVDGATGKSQPITVNFETQNEANSLNNIVGLINKAIVVALPDIIVTEVSKTQSFANQITGMPGIPSGMTFTYQNIEINTNGDVTFNVLVIDSNGNTSTSKTITVIGFVTPTQQELLDKNITDVNSANIIPYPNTLINTINSSNIGQYLKNLPTPLSGIIYTYQDLNTNSTTGQATFKIVATGQDGNSEISKLITITFETQTDANNIANAIKAINKANISAKANVLVSNVTSSDIATNISGLPQVPTGMTYKYIDVKPNLTTGKITFNIEVMDSVGDTSVSSPISVNFETPKSSNITSSSSITSSSNDIGIIVGGAIGGILGAALIGALVWYLIKRKKS